MIQYCNVQHVYGMLPQITAGWPLRCLVDKHPRLTAMHLKCWHEVDKAAMDLQEQIKGLAFAHVSVGACISFHGSPHFRSPCVCNGCGPFPHYSRIVLKRSVFRSRIPSISPCQGSLPMDTKTTVREKLKLATCHAFKIEIPCFFLFFLSIVTPILDGSFKIERPHDSAQNHHDSRKYRISSVTIHIISLVC